LTEIEAGFCNSPQPSCTAFRRGGDIVGDQYIHDFDLG